MTDDEAARLAEIENSLLWLVDLGCVDMAFDEERGDFVYRINDKGRAWAKAIFDEG